MQITAKHPGLFWPEWAREYLALSPERCDTSFESYSQNLHTKYVQEPSYDFSWFAWKRSVRSFMAVCESPTTRATCVLLQRKELYQIRPEPRRFYISTTEIREWLWVKMRIELIQMTFALINAEWEGPEQVLSYVMVKIRILEWLLSNFRSSDNWRVFWSTFWAHFGNKTNQ